MLRKAARCEPPVSAAIRQLCAARLASGIDAACKAAATALRPAAEVGASTQAEVLQDNPGCEPAAMLSTSWVIGSRHLPSSCTCWLERQMQHPLMRCLLRPELAEKSGIDIETDL